jgi:type II secretory pathway predicted ATPase ExeA
VPHGQVEKLIISAASRFLTSGLITQSLRDFFLRKPPSLSTGILASIDDDRDTQKLVLITQAVCQLDNTFLSIIGPLGMGKTYTASHVIVELLKQGKRIGITSNSHKSINNLMSSVVTLLLEHNIQIPKYPNTQIPK